MTARLLASAALLALLVTSCAATLAVRGTTPTMLNDGSCLTPVGAYAVLPMWVFAHARPLTSSSGAVSFYDSLWRNPGDPFNFSWTAPAGTYFVTAWAKNAGGPSCSTSIVLTAASRPAAPTITP